MYTPQKTNKGDVYRVIFVVCHVPDHSKNGKEAYQLRIHPESFHVHDNLRINHTQLTLGSRFAALIGVGTMEVYGAGNLYFLNKKLVAIDTTSGHYFTAFNHQDNAVIDATLGFISALGYHTADVMSWGELLQLLNDLLS
jgi:hypothetical protein